MYSDILYLSGPADDADLSAFIAVLGLHVLPERPGGPMGLGATEVNKNPCRMLSLKPIQQVAIDRKPFAHYSPVVAPLVEWKAPQIRDRLLIAGHMRHHPYMEKEGEDYREIGQVFFEIEAWMKSNWIVSSRRDFIGQQAQRMIAEGYRSTSFDPKKTTFVNIRLNDPDV
jgi:hypothetical protein